MREVILKAILKAQARGLDASQTADLAMDYLDIAADMGSNPAFSPAGLLQMDNGALAGYMPEGLSASRGDRLVFKGGILTEYGGNTLVAPPKVGQVLNKAVDPDADYWTAEGLFDELGSVKWEFSATPEGFNRPLEYKGMPVKNPRGQNGVGVIFSCPDVKEPRELPVFFPLSEKVIDPAAKILEVKSAVEQLFRIRDTPIANATKPITSFPSITNLGAGAPEAGNL